jgi:hypothetical protein
MTGVGTFLPFAALHQHGRRTRRRSAGSIDYFLTAVDYRRNTRHRPLASRASVVDREPSARPTPLLFTPTTAPRCPTLASRDFRPLCLMSRLDYRRLSELHALKIDLFLRQQGLDTTTPADNWFLAAQYAFRARKSAAMHAEHNAILIHSPANVHSSAPRVLRSFSALRHRA